MKFTLIINLIYFPHDYPLSINSHYLSYPTLRYTNQINFINLNLIINHPFIFLIYQFPLSNLTIISIIFFINPSNFNN